MTTMIEAVFVGDSHGMIMQSAAAEDGLRFRHPITAASAMFAGSTLTLDDQDQAVFQIDPGRTDAARIAPEKAAHRLHKGKAIEQLFRKGFATGLPLYSNIGMTARTFVLRIATAAKANGEDPSAMSAKLARMAASEFFQPYADIYATMARQAPKVVAVYGPTRFDEATRNLWLAYDDAVRRMLEERGVEVLDLRAQLGDDQLLLRPEFHGDPDDGVHGGKHWGATVVRAIADHVATAGADRQPAG